MHTHTHTRTHSHTHTHTHTHTPFRSKYIEEQMTKSKAAAQIDDAVDTRTEYERLQASLYELPKNLQVSGKSGNSGGETDV
jgi:hypothetical protein